MRQKLREQYCLEKGGINPSNIIEWYYIEWLEYKLTQPQQTVSDELNDIAKEIVQICNNEFGTIWDSNMYEQKHKIIQLLKSKLLQTENKLQAQTNEGELIEFIEFMDENFSISHDKTKQEFIRLFRNHQNTNKE